MRGLIIKDLLFIKNTWKSLIIMLIGAILISISLGNFLLTICIIPIMLMTSSITSFQTDEFFNSNTYYLTFPFSRKKMVLSKYIFTIVLLLMSTYIGFMIYTIIRFGFNPGFNGCNFDMIKYLIMMEFAAIIVDCIFYPVIYKYGCDKGRFVLLSIVMVILGICAILTMVIDFDAIMNTLQQLLIILNKYGVLILSVLCILSLIISYIISVKIYEKKDL